MAKHDQDTALGPVAASAAKPPFQAVVLVCRDCEDRKNGPEHLECRQVRKDLKSVLRERKAKARIVECSCLGTCPKKALMVAAMRSGEPIRGLELRAPDDLAQVARTLGCAG